MSSSVLLVRDAAHPVELAGQVRASAAKLQAWIASYGGDGIGLLRALKFDQVGFHPLDGHALNAIEQVNQIWTYLTALSAVRVLLECHPDAGGFSIAPGAHAAQPLDVMSQAEGLVGAEAFAAVDPANNRKLAKDLAKLTKRSERHRYVFFASPRFAGTRRLPQLERSGIQVWSVDV
ncbi:MAG: hypothetical protein J0M00_07685 [Burkholderiales bacterium]|nr:hypothetical protein [Burkholderiales bacterium]